MRPSTPAESSVGAPYLVPVAPEEIGDAAVLLEELIRDLEHREEQATLRAGPCLMPAARGTPHELPCVALTFGADQAAFEHVGLLDSHVLVVGKARARRHLH